MSLERRCPYCERAFTITYIELCAIPPGLGYRRWHGRCLHCNCDLQASTCWEMLTIIATFLVSFAIVFLIFPHHKPSGWASFVYVIMAFPILSSAVPCGQGDQGGPATAGCCD